MNSTVYDIPGGMQLSKNPTPENLWTETFTLTVYFSDFHGWADEATSRYYDRFIEIKAFFHCHFLRKKFGDHKFYFCGVTTLCPNSRREMKKNEDFGANVFKSACRRKVETLSDYMMQLALSRLCLWKWNNMLIVLQSVFLVLLNYARNYAQLNAKIMLTGF